jgi:hypothetical protein
VPGSRGRRLLVLVAIGAACVALYCCCARQSATFPGASDGASNALEAWDQPQGNWLQCRIPRTARRRPLRTSRAGMRKNTRPAPVRTTGRNSSAQGVPVEPGTRRASQASAVPP